MIYLLGDVHGCFGHILPALRADDPADGKPKTAIFLGDIEAQRPLEDEIAPLLDAGIGVWFIHGNHDTDSSRNWEHLLPSWHRNLHGRVAMIEGLRVAGLGGIFRGKVWYPPATERLFDSYADYERDLRQKRGIKNRLSKMDKVQMQAVPSPRSDADLLDTSRQGKLLLHSSTIFPDVYDQLAKQKADILVTHEAPSCHPHGFVAIDLLAQAMEVEALFHGHQHDCLNYRAWDATLRFKAYGVGFCGITDMFGGKLLAGDFDEARHYREGHPL